VRSAGIALIVAVALGCGGASDHALDDPDLPGLGAPSASLVAELRAARVARGPTYQPHTRHLFPDGAPRFTNRLILESSPYLLQHAHNPVSWYAWGPEPFARARHDHKLVLVSIGYATCHWCHVMEEESFDDVEVARFLNANFVCVKVDREARPDVDAIYMRAVIALTGDGGWPLNVVTDADRRPVFGATYLRPDDLRATLGQLRAIQDRDPARLVTAAEDLVAAVARDGVLARGPAPGPDAIDRGVRALAARFDATWGGFGTGAKFPSPPELDLLLRAHLRTGDPAALAMVTTTLDHLAAGGIHDQLGGGFHRYATDRQWDRPHFETTLYDNAQLAMTYLAAAQATGRADLAGIARGALAYIGRDLAAPGGGFIGATDADSRAADGAMVEGAYYTWTPAELDAATGATAPLVRAWFGVDGGAPIDGRSVLRAPRSLEAVAAELSLPVDLARAQLALASAQLRVVRAARTPPARDDKIVTSWTGLAISAFARAGFVLDEAADVDRAVGAAEFALAHLRAADGHLYRSWRDGPGAAGTLDDYAFLIQGLLDLFEARSEPRWLAAAIALADQLDARFTDGGGWAMTDAAAEPMLVRLVPIDDGAEPSGNAVAIRDLLRLAALTGAPRWRIRAEAALAAFAGPLHDRDDLPALRAALAADLDAAPEIVIVAPRAVAEAAALVAVVRRADLAERALIVTTAGAALDQLADLAPMVAGKAALGGAPTAFVCAATRCRAPTADPAELAAQLRRYGPR
jgi:hypothetical protein